MPISQKCGIFLFRFQDSPQMPAWPTSFFRTLFLKRGAQSLNDYWAEISYGTIDLEGSEIHGWRTLPMTAEEFIAQYPSRYEKIWGAASYFTGVDSKQYAMIIAITDANLGDAGNSGGVLVSGAVDHTFIAHEMAHSLGLGHSFDTSDRKTNDWSAPGEYWNRYDLMSAMNVHTVGHNNYTNIGPRLCAHFVRLKGWIPDHKIWKLPVSNGHLSLTRTFDLVALGHAEQPGFLMAQLHDYTVEFRMREDWDGGIPRDGVLIHHIAGETPVLIASDLIQDIQDWQPGQTWTNKPGLFDIYGDKLSVTVDSFDLANYSARITVSLTAGRRVTEDSVWGEIIGAVINDGGGLIIVGGKIVKVPPRGPVVRIMEVLSEIEQSQSDDAELLRNFRMEKLENLRGLISEYEALVAY